MVLHTNKFRLEYFEQGSPYYLDSERRRFAILDLQINSILKQFSEGVVSGFNVTKNSTSNLTIDITDGLAFVPTFIQETENDKKVIKKSNIAVRSFKTTSLLLDQFQSYLVYLVPLSDEKVSDEIVILADNNVFRNAITTESGTDAYSKYLIDLPSVDVNNDDLQIFINGKRFLGPHSFEGQYVVFPNRRLETDTVQVRVVPKDSLPLAIVETGSNNILSIDESVKIYVSGASNEGQTIPQALISHNHRDDGTELSLSKIKLTSKTRTITGNVLPPENSSEDPNTTYLFPKTSEGDIDGLIEDDQFYTDFKSFNGTISSNNIRFDELVDLTGTENIQYNGYFVNPDVSQANTSKIISTSNNGKNVVAEDILSNFINIVNDDQYQYLIYPYEIIVFVNGIREYSGFWLYSDDNESIKIRFSSPLSDSDVVQAQLNLISELTQIKGLLKTDALTDFSQQGINAFFSASNINEGYLTPEMIPRVSHVGRSKELLIPIPTESDDPTESLDLIYCETNDRKNFRPWLNNVPPLKSVKHVNKIDESWYICANNTVITSQNERLFGDLSIQKNYREDSPIPLKTDYVGNATEDNIIPILLTEKSVMKKTATGWRTLATTPNFASNANLYTDEEDQFVLPGAYALHDIVVDHSSDNIFVSASNSSSANPTEIFSLANQNTDNGINTWVKVYSNPDANIKDIEVHNGHIYAISRLNGVDNVLRTVATPSEVVSQAGNVITIPSADIDNFYVNSTLRICRSISANEFTITQIETGDTTSRITLNRAPNIALVPGEDMVIPGWSREPKAFESNYDKIYSLNGQLYASAGAVIFESFVPILASNVTFSTVYSLSVLNGKVVIATDTGIYYLQSTFYSYGYGYGWGGGAGINFFDVFGSVGTRFGYGGGNFEEVYANLYAYGYGFELRKSGIWVEISNQTYDTPVNDSVLSTNYLYSFEYNENSGSEELYLSCDDGVFQIESTASPYDISIRNAFPVLGQPLSHDTNIFTNNFLSGSVTAVNSTTKVLTVKCNLRNLSTGATIVFDSTTGGVNASKEFRILSINNNNSLENLYDIRIDRIDGKFTKSQQINPGQKFRAYPHSDPLVFINNNPQSSTYNKYYENHSFSYNAQKITFTNTLTPSDVVTAISKIKHFYSLRGPWNESLSGSEKVYLNNRLISTISGTWKAINSVEYNDFSTGEKVLVKEVILETNQNVFFGFNLSGTTIIPNTLNEEDSYTVQSNSWNTIRIRSDNPISLQESIQTNSSTGESQSISDIRFSIEIGVSLNNDVEILPFGNVGLVSLPSPVLTNQVARITIPSSSGNGYITGIGNLTHQEIQDALAKHEDGLPHKFSGIKNANLLQYIAALDNIMNVFDIVSFDSVEIDDFSASNAIDLINSTIENSKLYEQNDCGDFSRYVFNIIYSSDLGGTYALTDKGVYFKPDTSDSTEKWIKKSNVVQYMSADGDPTIPDEFKGVFIGYDKTSDVWTISWGEDFRIESRNNGLNNHYITAIDLDPTDSSKVYFATKQHGIYRSTNGGDSSWETLFHPGAFDAKGNINNSKYEFSDLKVSGSKNYMIFALMKNNINGGVYVSNDDGANFELHQLTDKTVGAIGNENYNFLKIPLVQDGSDLGTSQIVYWGSNNLYRKQYSYGFGLSGRSTNTNDIVVNDNFEVTNSPQQWKVDIINRQIIDSSVRSDFQIYDIAVRESNTSHIFLATSNGIYKSVHDGQVLRGTVNDYRYIGDKGSTVFSIDELTTNESISHTKLWVTFESAVPEEIFQIGKYFRIWEKPLKLISYEKVSDTQVFLYFEYFDPKIYVFYPGSGFENHTQGYNVRGFSSWNKVGENISKIRNPKKLLLTSDDILYIGTDGRGVFVSPDLGSTFSELNDGFTELIQEENLSISGFDTDASGNIYCSTLDVDNFGGGLWKLVSNSWNRIGGAYSGNSASFTITDGMAQHNVTTFKVSQSDANTIFVGTNSGAYKTTNGGTSWTAIALPTEYNNVARFFSDNKTAFLGSQFSGILKTRNKGLLWYQDFRPEEKNVDKIRNVYNWRIWDLRYSGRSTDSENGLYINVYRNLYTPGNGILYNIESLNNSYTLQKNDDTGFITTEEDSKPPIYIGQTVAGVTADGSTVSKNLKKTSYYELRDSYPGILETSLYNAENHSFLANITKDGTRYISYNNTLNTGSNNPPVLFKHQDSIHDYRKIHGLLLDHTSVTYQQFDGNPVSTLTRSGIFEETKQYNIKKRDIKQTVKDVSTKSSLSDYNICDIIKHSSLDKYYIATEQNGVFEASDIDQIKPANFYRGLGTISASSTKLTDSRVDFSTNNPVGSTIYFIANTSSGSIVDSQTISSLDGTDTVVFSTASISNGSSYYYVITDRSVSNINSHTNYNLAINNPIEINGDYFDIIEDENNAFVYVDQGSKIYLFDIETADLTNHFPIDSVSSGLAYIPRQRISFREDGETRLLLSDISHYPLTEETTFYFNSFYKSEGSISSWVGMLIQPNISQKKFYKITSVNADTKSVSISDPSGSAYFDIHPSLFLGTSVQVYSNIYHSIFNAISDMTNSGYVIFDYANFSRINNGLSSFESEYLDDHGNAEIDLKFNKLYFESPIIYAATEMGVWKYDTSALSPAWSEANTGISNLSIKDITGDGGSYLFVASYGGGVYRSSNSGSSWTSISTGLNHTKVWSISVDPNDSNNLLAGTKDGGVYKSTNATAPTPTWTPFSIRLDRKDILNWNIKANYGNPNTVYAWAYGSGVFKSTNAGNNWNPMSSGLTNLNVTSLDICKVDSNKIIVSTDGGGLFEYNGVKWIKVKTNNLPHPVVSKVLCSNNDRNSYFVVLSKIGPETLKHIDGSRLFNLFNSANPQSVYKTTDNGKSWKKIFELSNTDDSKKQIDIEYDASGNLIISTKHHVYLSDNQGENFTLQTDLSKINFFRNNPVSNIDAVNPNPNQKININMIGTRSNQQNVLYVSQDQGETYRAAKIGEDQYDVYGIASTTISKLQKTQNVTISVATFDPSATITKASYISNANWTELTVEYGPTFQGYLNADFGKGLLNVSGESKRFELLNKPNDLETDSNKLFLQGKFDHFANKRFKVDSLYSIDISVDGEDNFLISNSMVDNYVKIKTGTTEKLYKIARYTVVDSTATIIFVDNTELRSTGDFTNAVITIGSLNEDGDDIDDIAVIYAPHNGSFVYSMNYGYYWITPSTLQNDGANITTGTDGLQGFVNGQDFTTSGTEITTFELKDDNLYISYIDDNTNQLVSSQIFSTYSNALKDGLSRSYNGTSSVLYVTTSSNVYSINKSLTTSEVLSGLPSSISSFEKSFQVSPSSSTTAFFFADGLLYTTTDLSNWNSRSILIDNNTIRPKDIKFIQYHPTDDSKMIMSIDINDDPDNSLNGLYLSPNRGGTWNKLAFESKNLINTNLIFDQADVYNTNTFYFNAHNDTGSYLLTNNNGILGSTVNGVYYSDNLWITSTPDGITVYQTDDSETNEFKYKFVTYPTDYFLDNPKCMYYHQEDGLLIVGSSKGIEFYNLSSDMSISNNVEITSGIISNNVNKITFDGSNFVVATSQGICFIPKDTYSNTGTYTNVDIDPFTKGQRSSDVVDLDYDADFNRILFITKDSIYIRENNGDIKSINPDNSSLNDQVLTSVAARQSPSYEIDYSTGDITFSNIPLSLKDEQEIVVVKTITKIGVERPVSGTDYISPVQSTIANVVDNGDGTQTLTLDVSETLVDSGNSVTIIVRPEDPLSTQVSVQSIDADTNSVVISSSAVQVTTGDKFILSDSLGSTSFVIFSGTSSSFTDESDLKGKNQVYSFYTKDSNGVYTRIYATTINISESTSFDGIKTTKPAQFFVGSNRGLFYLNSSEYDIIETSFDTPINDLEIDQHGRVLVGTVSNGLFVFSNEILNKNLVSSNINNYTINGIFGSSDSDRIVVFSNETMTVLEKDLLTIVKEYDSEFSYDTINFSSSSKIPNLKLVHRSSSQTHFSLTADNEISIFDQVGQTVSRTTNERSDFVVNDLIVVNNPSGLLGNPIRFVGHGENSVIIGTSKDLYVSTGQNQIFRKTLASSSSTYNINRVSLVEDKLYLFTDNYDKKLIIIEDVTPYSLRPGQSFISANVIDSSDNLFNQTIYSVMYNSDGTAIWAGGFGSLYYRSASSDTEWTEVSMTNVGSPFLKYRRLYNSAKSGNPIYAITEYPNINNSNLVSKESNILKIDSSFNLEVMSSGYSFEKDSGKYSLAFSAPAYDPSYTSSSNRAKDSSLLGLLTTDGISDINISSLVESNSTNNLIFGASHNNLRFLTYPFQYEKEGIDKDTSLQIGYRSIESNRYSLPAAHEKAFISTTPGIMEKYKPVRVTNVFESNYDSDLMFASVFNPGELDNLSNKEFYTVQNEKSLDHDYGWLMKSTDGGVNWCKIGHGLPTESFVSDVVDDGDSNIFVSIFGSSTAKCGVWYSTNGGRTFTDISKNLPKKPIKSLYYAENVEGYPDFGGILYVGFWGGGIWKLNTSETGYGYSTYGNVLTYGYGYENLDAGVDFFDVFGFSFETEQWQEINFEAGYKRGKNLTKTNVVDISGFKNDFHESIWVATASDGVLYSDSQSINTLGTSWTQRNAGLKTSNLTSILASEFNETDVWLGTSSGFYTYDTVENKWNLISSGIPETRQINTIEHDTHFFNTFIPVKWSNVSGSDGTLVLRTPGSIATTDVPLDDKSYVKGDIIGSSIVAYVGSGDYSSTAYQDIGRNIDVGKEYFYKFYSYSISGDSITYTKFTNPLVGELAKYEMTSPYLLTLSTFEANVENIVYIDNSADRHDGETLVLLQRTENSSEIENLLAQKASILNGYSLKYTDGNGTEYSHTIDSAVYEGVFISGDITSTLSSGTDVTITPGLSDDELIGFALNPSISQSKSDNKPDNAVLFEITDNTETTITVRQRNDRQTVGSVSDLVAKEYRLADGTIWDSNKIRFAKNGLVYTSDPNNPQRLYPIYGPVNQGSTYRSSNTVTVLSSQLLKAQTITPLYLGTDSGLYRSVDNGNTFEYKSLTGYSINDIVISIENLEDRTLQTADDAVIYISTTSGLFKSEDGGATVSQIGVATFGSNNVEKIIIETRDKDETIYVNYPNNGIYYSKNAGVTWTEIESDTSDLDINDIDLSKDRSHEFILTTSGDGIKNYIEPFNERMDISVKSDDKIENVSNVNIHIGDNLINYRDRVVVESLLRKSSYSNLKSIDVKEDHQGFLEISVKKNGSFIPSSNIYVGSDSSAAPSNPFRLNKVTDENYPDHVFDTAFLPNGNIFIATNVGGFISSDGSSWKKAGNYLTPNHIYAVAVLKNKSVVIGTNNGYWVSTDNGTSFSETQLSGNNVRAIWQYSYEGVTKTWIAGDFGMRTIIEGDNVIRISSPETFDNSDGIAFSWGSRDENNDPTAGGMTVEFLDFLNTRREYWIPGAQNNPTYSTGWGGLVVVRNQGSEADFVPQDDATYREEYRRHIEPPDNNLFFDPPSIRPFTTGLVVSKLITNTGNVLDEETNVFSSPISIGHNTFDTDNPFIDTVHLTQDYDLDPTNKYNGYPEPSGAQIDYTKDYGEYGGGARLIAETTYYYSIFAFFNRPSTTIFYDIKRPDQLLPEYYPIKFDEYSFDLKMRHFNGATQILCGEALSVDEVVVGTDNGVFYDDGNGLKQSDLSGVEVTSIKFIQSDRLYPVAGYGFGYGGEGIAYFDVFGVEGTLTGYGTSDFDSQSPNVYGYGQGFEYQYINKVFVGTNDGIYRSNDKGATFLKVFSFTNTDFNVVNNFIVNSNNEVLASTNIGILKKNPLTDLDWTLIDKVVGSADDASEGRLLGQSFKLNEIII